jgi:hypothetical protein
MFVRTLLISLAVVLLASSPLQAGNYGNGPRQAAPG